MEILFIIYHYQFICFDSGYWKYRFLYTTSKHFPIFPSSGLLFWFYYFVFVFLEIRNKDLKLFCRIKCSIFIFSYSQEKTKISIVFKHGAFCFILVIFIPPSSAKLLIKCQVPFEMLNSTSCQFLQLWKVSPIYFNCLLSGGSNQMTVIWEVFPIRAMSLDSPDLSAIPYTSDNEQPDN